MSRIDVDLVKVILGQYFGSIVESVGKTLAECGPSPLRQIATESRERVVDVKKSLRVLMHHNLAKCKLHPRGFVEYTLDLEAVLAIVRFPQYINVAKLLYQEYGEQLMEEMLKEGQIELSKLLMIVTEKFGPVTNGPADLPRQLYDVFQKMASARFVERTIDTSKTSVEEIISEKETTRGEDPFKFSVPHVNFADIAASVIKTEVKVEGGDDGGEPAPKKRKVEETKQPDQGIHWKVNLTRFHAYLRDMSIVSGAKNYYEDEKVGEIVRIILQISETTTLWEETTKRVSKQEISSVLIKEKLCANGKEVESLLALFDNVNNPYVQLVEKAASGGMYIVNTFKCLTLLTEACVTSIVEHRFGGKCARIFRILLAKKRLQQKQIEEIAMLPQKECRELTFMLVREGFVKTLQVPKQADYQPSKTFFVFSVDMDSVVRITMDICKKAIHNAIARREHDYSQHKPLIERKFFVDQIIENLKLQENTEQQISDLEQQFSTHENELLRELKSSFSALECSELQVDETFTLLQTWLNMNGKIILVKLAESSKK
ncbi:DNA-directed RNA polymerase III subunit RPC3 [Halotydeus destructor]|nr:DNA-directed RNA polymerase III subunit RPC3 [Halotydeus destructor]